MLPWDERVCDHRSVCRTKDKRTLTPEQIGSRVGLRADRTRKKGERRASSPSYKGPTIREGETRWELRSTLAEDEPIEAHIDSLSQRVGTAAGAIKGLAEDNTVKLACVIYAHSEGDYNPEVFLSKSTVEFLGALGASVWVDVYLLADGEEPG